MNIVFGGNNTTGEIDVATACNARGGTGRMDFESETFVARPLKAGGNDRHDESHETYIAHTLRGEGHDASEDGTGRGVPIIPAIPILEADGRAGPQRDRDGIGVGNPGDPMYALQAGKQHAIGFAQNQRDEVREMDVAGALSAEPGMKQTTYVAYRTSGNCGVMEQGDKTAALTTSTDPNANIVAYQCHGSNVGPMGTLRAGNGNEAGGVPFTITNREQQHDRAASESVGASKMVEGHERPAHAATLHADGQPGLSGEPFAFQSRVADNGRGAPSDTMYALTEAIGKGGQTDRRPQVVDQQMAVRRLMPIECLRLQGFPDAWLDDLQLSDSAKYRMTGNSVAVPVVEWIAKRIQLLTPS